MVEPTLPMVEPTFVVSLKDYLMAEPENHTLRRLREIRVAIGTVDTRVDSLDKKVDRNHEELKQRIENLRQAAFGENVLGRYAARRSLRSGLRPSKAAFPPSSSAGASLCRART